MKTAKGFTLIEVLIALSIFAILATLTSSSLYYAFNNRARVNAQAEQLNNLQLAISIMQQDTLQAVDRSIRGNDMHTFPGFIGQANYFELTRGGIVNPDSLEQRSTLKRIALVCENNQLVHRTWESLDTLDRNVHNDKVLLSNLSACNFKYLNQSLQMLNEWRAQALAQDQTKEPLPKAIQVNVTLKEWGEMNLLFIIPGALYAK
ncbi:MAG: GspJ family T2SS minor pseudopilin variant LspJ [Legionella sp.]|jgi:general secretion pathway protein J